MLKGFFNVPAPVNEPVKSYAPGSTERKELQAMLKTMRSSKVDVPQFIGGEEVRSGKKLPLNPPHDHKHLLGHYHEGDKKDVKKAIDAALKAKKSWEAMAWEQRAAIFLKAADLLAGPYRARMNAATMLGQGKNAFQAEIDSACEFIDFLRFNVQYMTQIYAMQPESAPGVWNRLEHRPLEGFVLAVTPFNFTAIAGNLPASPAMMGNVVVWKPSNTQIYSAHVIMDLFREAGLPDGVINLVLAPGPEVGEICFAHREFSGLHFTGSTGTFQHMWREIGKNIDKYRSYPRIVGETGGKDFVVAHPSAGAQVVATALLRGAFEYQGQKCSAASRAYIPSTLWNEVRPIMEKELKTMKMGGPEDFGNFINAVIDERSFDKISEFISHAKKSPDADIIMGGKCDKKKGYFVEPTVILAKTPDYRTMCEEIFGPVLTVFVYQDSDFDVILDTVDKTSPYALTGSIFAQDRQAIEQATYKLRNAAGNFYINDKPTGAVVGQQPFGGGRASGTNDKAGSLLNLLRWVSPRTIKETFDPPKDYRYPFLEKD